MSLEGLMALMGAATDGSSIVQNVRQHIRNREFRRAKAETARLLVYYAPTSHQIAQESWELYLGASAATSLTEDFHNALTEVTLTNVLRQMGLIATPPTPEQLQVINSLLELLIETGSAADQIALEKIDKVRQQVAAVQEITSQNSDFTYAALKTLLERVTPSSSSNPHEIILERIRSFLNAGNIVAGEEMLNDFEQVIARESINNSSRASYLRMRGAVSRIKGDYDNAISQYKSAFGFDSTSSPALLTRGLASLLEENPEEALPYLRAVHTHDELYMDARRLEISALSQIGDYVALDAIQNKLQSDDVETALALVDAAWLRKAFDKATQILDILTSGNRNNDPRLLLSKALTYLLETQTHFANSVEELLKVGQQPGALEALQWLDDAIPRLKADIRRRDDLQRAFESKLVLLAWRKDLEPALEFSREAITTFPDVERFLKLTFILLLRRNDYSELLRQYDRSSEGSRTVELRMMALDAAQGNADWNKVLEIASSLSGNDFTKEEWGEIILAQVLASLRIEPDSAPTYLPDPADDEPWQVLFARAKIQAYTGAEVEGTELARQAIAGAPPFHRVNLAIQWAKYLVNVGELETARDMMAAAEPVAESDVERLARMYYDLGMSSGVRKLTEMSAHSGWILSPVTRHIAAIFALRDGDMARAISQLDNLLAEYPDEPEILLHAIAAKSFSGDKEGSKIHLQHLNTLPLHDAKALIHAANFAQQLNVRNLTMDFAYRALRTDYGNEEAHANYLGLALDHQEDGNLELVQAECAVLLRANDGAGEQWVILTADEDPSPERKEFPLDSPMAQHLLNKKLGDKVTLRPGVGGQVEVASILTKYANAERRILQEYHQLFPTSERLQQFDVKDELERGELPSFLQELFDKAQVRQKNLTKIRQDFDQQGIPTVANAILRNESVANFWFHEIESGLGIESFDNDLIDQQAADEALKKGAVIDLSTLISLENAGLLDELAGWLPRLAIPRHVVIKLQHQQRETKLIKPERLKRILDFVDKNVDIVPSPDTNDAGNEKWAEVIPIETRSGVFASRGQQIPLVTEDARFRRANRTIHMQPQVPSCGTIDLLLAIERSGRMEAGERAALIHRLSQHGHVIYPVDVALVHLIIKEDAGEFGSNLNNLIKHMTHFRILPNKRAGALVILLYAIWMDSRLFTKRWQIAIEVAQQIAKYPDWEQVLRYLIVLVIDYFQATPVSREELLGVLNAKLRHLMSSEDKTTHS